MTFIYQLKKFESRATTGQWVKCNVATDPSSPRRDIGVASVQFPGNVSDLISTNTLKDNAALICLLRNNTQAIIELVEAAEKYEAYLPASKPIGANRFVGMLVAADNLRSAIAKIKGDAREVNDTADGKFIVQYHNPNRLGKATQAAMELAERAKGFTSIEIQAVPHEEITRLKARIRLLEDVKDAAIESIEANAVLLNLTRAVEAARIGYE
jgi:hypothetical protein